MFSQRNQLQRTEPMPFEATTRYKVIGLLAAGFVVLMINIFISIWASDRASQFTTLTVADQQLKTSLYQLLSAAQDAETGQRGYLLTGDESYLEPYKAASENLPRRLLALETMSSRQSSFAEKLPELRSLVDQRMQIIRESLDHMRSGNRAQAVDIVQNGSGKVIMDKLRALVATLVAQETAHLQAGITNVEWWQDWSRIINWLTLALFLILAAMTASIIWRFIADLEAAHIVLRELNSGLERTVEERTGEILRANEEIQRFAYIVSHDLRAPLVNIMGFTSELEAIGKMVDQQHETLLAKAPELLLPDTSTAVKIELPEAVGFIRASTAKMDRLINAILNLSREGRRVLVPTNVNIKQLVENIAKSLRHQLDDNGGEITIGALPNLMTDRLAIEQIFSNLIENALKYTEPGRTPKIEVSGSTEAAEVEYLIKDNGRGIEVKDLDRIFELFRRAGKQDTAGEGLGLAFVRASVRRLGGTINVTSELGTGTTFKLRFPSYMREGRRAQDD